MKKQACLEASERAAKSAKEAQGRFALYMTTFGGKDSLTVCAEVEMTQAIRASAEWKRIAEWHPSTRLKALRDRALPSYLFGYLN